VTVQLLVSTIKLGLACCSSPLKQVSRLLHLTRAMLPVIFTNEKFATSVQQAQDTYHARVYWGVSPGRDALYVGGSKGSGERTVWAGSAVIVPRDVH
jgi:hypothetical protein